MTKPPSVEDGIVFDETTNTFHARFDPKQTNPSEAIIQVLTEITQTNPSEMDPLFRAVDPEALDKILRSRPAGTVTEPLEATFEYQGHLVSVTASGILTVSLEDQEQAPED
jgi:hypothetical protein